MAEIDKNLLRKFGILVKNYQEVHRIGVWRGRFSRNISMCINSLPNSLRTWEIGNMIPNLWKEVQNSHMYIMKSGKKYRTCSKWKHFWVSYWCKIALKIFELINACFFLTLQRLIEEERQKRKLIDRDNQHLRRHSDFNPVKSPIITNDRFNDLLGEPPKVAEKPIPKWKQEVSNKVAMESCVCWYPVLFFCKLDGVWVEQIMYILQPFWIHIIQALS